MRKSSPTIWPVTITLLLLVLTPVLLYGQSRTTWETAGSIRNGVAGTISGTVSDIVDGRRIDVAADGDSGSARVRVVTDSIATRYVGFGERSESEVFQGATGFSKLRIGDRVEVRGLGASAAMINADQVLLLGRTVSTSSSASASASTGNRIEGIVRSVTTRDNRLVIETDARQMYTVFGSESTPVYYQGETYRILNLEVGDRVRVEVESKTADGVRARVIDVIRNVQDPASGTSDRRTLTSVSGRVIRVDARTQTFRIQPDRGGEIRVDARFAVDRDGKRFRIGDLQSGDRVEVSGEYDSTSTFRADTVRFGNETQSDRDRDPVSDEDHDDDADDEERDRVFDREDEDDNDDDNDNEDYVSVVIEGTVAQSLDGDDLRIRDSESGRTLRVLVDPAFIVKTKTGYSTAAKLKKGEKVTLKALRDDDRRYLAQTIRLR